jgi:hypothetical protein
MAGFELNTFNYASSAFAPYAAGLRFSFKSDQTLAFLCSTISCFIKLRLTLETMNLSS